MRKGDSFSPSSRWGERSLFDCLRQCKRLVWMFLSKSLMLTLVVRMRRGCLLMAPPWRLCFWGVAEQSARSSRRLSTLKVLIFFSSNPTNSYLILFLDFPTWPWSSLFLLSPGVWPSIIFICKVQTGCWEQYFSKCGSQATSIGPQGGT